MTTEVSIEKIRADAHYNFNHGFACSESVIHAIRSNFELEISDDAIAMSSGFAADLVAVAVFVVLWRGEPWPSVFYMAAELLMIHKLNVASP